MRTSSPYVGNELPRQEDPSPGRTGRTVRTIVDRMIYAVLGLFREPFVPGAMMNLTVHYYRLVDSLRLLALSPAEQVKCLPDFVVVHDEVIFTFADAFRLMPRLIDEGFLSRTAIASIIRCFNCMDLAVNGPSLCTPEAFRHHEAWHMLRQLAGQSLADMGEPEGVPDLSHIQWIPAKRS